MEETEEQTGGAGGEPFMSHIEELHAAVVEMKDAFEAAQKDLLSVQKDDSNLQKEIEVTRLQCNKQSSDILQSLSLVNEEVKAVREALQSSQMTQQELHATVQTLLIERDLLLDELLKNGAISRNVRSRLWSRTSEFVHSSSGSQSTNDSGVALLSDKTSFRPLEGSPTILSTFFRDGVTEDVLRRNEKDPEGPGTDRSTSSYGVGKSRESLFEPYAVSGSSGNVEEYLNKISQPTDFPHDESRFKGNNKPPPLQMTYDSDSSLTLAAAKSLSLSNSLSQQCGLELDEQDKRRQSRSRSGSARRDLSNEHHLQTSGGVNCSDGEDGMSQSAVEDKAFKDRHRYHVAKELLETERKYCQTLRTIEDKFANPLKRSDVLTMRDISTLFPDEVFELHVKHCALLAQLEERVALWRQKPAIGDLLERFTNEDGSDVLRLYTSYVNDFPEVLKTFHKLCRSSKEFTHFLKLSLEHPVCRGLDLGAFLLSPVQRMPQYILLFKKMIKFTDPSDPDYSDIKLCLDRLRDYLKRLNDSMEHSFQLVTAGMAPHLNHSPDDSPRQSHHRLSISSSQSEGESHHHHESLRARLQNKSRSKSVPRNQQELPIQRAELTLTAKPGKLKNKSKSHWAVCSTSDMGDNDTGGGTNRNGRRSRDQGSGGTAGGSYGRKMSSQSSQNHDTISKGSSSRLQYSSTNLRKSSRGILSEDSDIELHPSDVDESSDTETRESRRKSSSIATKSLPSFNPKYQRSGSFVSEPNLLEECDGNKRRVGDKSQRPLSLYKECPEKYSGNSRQRGSQRGTINSLGEESHSSKGKQRVSLRTSLKNIFSLKKRTTRTLQISGPILPSRPSLPISPPTSVPTLRFHQSMSEDHGQQQHHSLPPERMNSTVSSKIQIHHQQSQQQQQQQQSLENDRGNHLGENTLSSLPVRMPNNNGSHRFIKNPGIGNNFANPKLPKNPFMAKHFAHDKN